MLGSVRQFPHCTRSRFCCRSSWLCFNVAATRPVPSTVEKALALFQRLFIRRRVPRSARTVPSPQTLYVERLCCLRPFTLRPSCCYRLRTWLAPSLLCLLPSSAVSRRCLPVRLPLPPLVPVLRRLHCLYMFHVHRSSAPCLRRPPTRSAFMPSRCASPPFSLLGKDRPCHLGELCS